MVGFVGTQAKVLRVSSYVRNLDTFHLSTTRNPYQTDQSTSYKKSKILQDVVKHCLDFSFVFSAPLLACLKKPVFTKRDLLQWKIPARLYWDLLASGRYQPASCHYF
jgi:hypothetical protein